MGQREQVARRALLQFEFDLADRQDAVTGGGRLDPAGIEGDLDARGTLRDEVGPAFDCRREQRLELRILVDQAREGRVGERRAVGLGTLHRLLPFRPVEQAVAFGLQGLDEAAAAAAHPQAELDRLQLPIGRVEIDRAEIRLRLRGRLVQERMALKGGKIGDLAFQLQFDLARFAHPSSSCFLRLSASRRGRSPATVNA